MEYVDPIKDVEKINKIKCFLYKQSQRDYLFFVIGINTGLRITDLLNIKIKDIYDGKEINDYYFGEGTTPPIYLNNKVKKAVKDYLSNTNFNDKDFLFKSKKNNQPITRQQAYRIINKAANEVGVPGKIGTHTLRKTFGYHAYKKGIAISLIQEIFHHSSKSETLKYIGINNKKEKIKKIDVNL